ncbi:hypothetical protein SISSUDRAFT_1064401 [Sistotremastrum suecicum HHB10207 ss-3]|uniref:non-specific serine/threonine protein kinase n=1 Tax=Sistotremastrum suecicum HHB10207 ss-3 TaxID=1314776 RepID=A0A166APJ5_9AGAM|nr:hypothetical protein SISSUDRAFT_1064401 [Sistotremastrum suecicum HHB10207 ss-3]
MLLGSRTKQVNSYGKRNRRVIVVDDDQFSKQDSAPLRQQSTGTLSKAVLAKQQISKVPLSPIVALVQNVPKLPNGKTRGKERMVSTPNRFPLGLKNPNALDSPVINRHASTGKLPGTPNHHRGFTPFVDVEITVFDNTTNRRVSQEHRVISPRQNVIVIDSDSEDDVVAVKPARRPHGRNAIVISDDEEEEQEEGPVIPRPQFQTPPRQPLLKSRVNTLKSQLPAFSPRRTRTRSKQILQQQTIEKRKPSPIRQLSPIVTPPASASPSPAPRSPSPPPCVTAPQPAHLLPILTECGQTEPYGFDSFLSMFSADESHRSPPKEPFYWKIGEASYSEVFGCGDLVLKIIPLRDESGNPQGTQDEDEEWPFESDAADVLREIITTRATGELSAGFVKLLKSFIVKGKYPQALLDLWDHYHEKKGSESIRPDCFPDSQTYAIIVLPNGGPDLEAYDFRLLNPKCPWRKACEIFWQIVSALQKAENLIRFEHRDLHWGQILVKDLQIQGINESSHTVNLRGELAVQVLVIDLGLARMDAGDGENCEARWTEFDEAIFEGEGEYQYDIYRMMKVHLKSDWGSYNPLTNIMWMHYLCDKLLHAKRLPVPTRPRSRSKEPSALQQSERAYFESLIELEKILKKSIEVKRGRKPKILISSADELWQLGVQRQWVEDI